MEEKIFKNKKPALSIDDLLLKLKERDLINVDGDEELIKHKIKRLGYYRISRYFQPLEKESDLFKEKTTFKDILNLYEFDRELRLLSLHALKIVEIELKAVLTDEMSLKYESDWYINRDLFDTNKTGSTWLTISECEDGRVVHRKEKGEIKLYNSLLSAIYETLERDKGEDFIAKFKNEYGSMETLPCWMMMQSLSFGKLSRLFALIKPCEESRRVANHFGASSVIIFSSWLHAFVVLRNSCAHHSRVWNKKLLKDLQFPKKKEARFVTKNYESTDNIDNDHTRYYYGVSSCLIKCLIAIDPEFGNKFRDDVLNLIDKYKIENKLMGFPAELEDFDIWR